MKQRILVLLTSAILCCCLFTVTAFATTETEDKATVTVENGQITVSNGAEGTYPVTVVDANGNVLDIVFVEVDSSGNGSEATDVGGTSAKHHIPGMGTSVTEEHTHSYTSEVTKDATCTETGVRTYTCSCGHSYTETIAALGHSYGEETVTKEATCGAAGTKTSTCSRCGDEKTETIPATGNHTWDSGTVTTAATSTTAGVKTYTCTVCGATKTESIPATGSSSSGGSGGGSSSSSDGYTVSVSSASHGKVTASPSSATKGTKVTLTVKPDDGYELADLVVTDKNGDEVDLTKVSDTKYTFTMPSGKVTVTPTFVKTSNVTPGDTEPGDTTPTVTNPFADVTSSAYYYDAVLWAVENGVTTGTSATTFSPDQSCTRAQMVTFLWRAAGSPSVSGANPFTDVQAGTYYYDAVLWAVSKGITTGTSETTFSPDMTVTRAQTVTFLYRYEGSPAVSGSSPFTDVSSSVYYASAVQWAVNNAVTTGTSATTFSPDMDCSRAQIVTFLYRDLVG